MAVYIPDGPQQQTPVPFALRHAIALDLALLLLQEERTWWQRLWNQNDQTAAIRDLLEWTCAELGWDWISRPKNMSELWRGIQGPLFDAFTKTTPEFDWLKTTRTVTRKPRRKAT